MLIHSPDSINGGKRGGLGRVMQCFQPINSRGVFQPMTGWGKGVGDGESVVSVIALAIGVCELGAEL